MVAKDTFGTGRGSFTQTASGYTGTVGYPDIGAAQRTTTELPDVTAQAIIDGVWAATVRTLTAATNITSTGGTTVPQTGDAYGRIGVAGAGLTAIGDARLANLDTNVGSRMATYTQPAGFLAATFPTTVSSYAGGAVASVMAGVTETTNNDKAGYALTQTFPTNFAALGITAGGKVSGVVLVDAMTGNIVPNNAGITIAASAAAAAAVSAASADTKIGTPATTLTADIATLNTLILDVPTNTEFASAVALLSTNAQLVKVLAAVYDDIAREQGEDEEVLTLSNGATQTVNDEGRVTEEAE